MARRNVSPWADAATGRILSRESGVRDYWSNWNPLEQLEPVTPHHLSPHYLSPRHPREGLTRGEREHMIYPTPERPSADR